MLKMSWQLFVQVHKACSSGHEHVVVSYSRRAFSQTGDGHFSPVGGYNQARDLVLILDTARFKCGLLLLSAGVWRLWFEQMCLHCLVVHAR